MTNLAHILKNETHLHSLSTPICKWQDENDLKLRDYLLITTCEKTIYTYILLLHTYLVVMGSSWNFLRWAESSQKCSDPSQAWAFHILRWNQAVDMYVDEIIFVALNIFSWFFSLLTQKTSHFKENTVMPQRKTKIVVNNTKMQGKKDKKVLIFPIVEPILNSRAEPSKAENYSVRSARTHH